MRALFGSKKTQGSRAETGGDAAPRAREEPSTAAFRQASDGKLLASAAANQGADAPPGPRRRPTAAHAAHHRRRSGTSAGTRSGAGDRRRGPQDWDRPHHQRHPATRGGVRQVRRRSVRRADHRRGQERARVPRRRPQLSEQAHRVLLQYDNYPAELDIKEFSALCRDIRMMVKFDTNGDGALDASELAPALGSVGLRLSPAQIAQASRPSMPAVTAPSTCSTLAPRPHRARLPPIRHRQERRDRARGDEGRAAPPGRVRGRLKARTSSGGMTPTGALHRAARVSRPRARPATCGVRREF